MRRRTERSQSTQLGRLPLLFCLTSALATTSCPRLPTFPSEQPCLSGPPARASAVPLDTGPLDVPERVSTAQPATVVTQDAGGAPANTTEKTDDGKVSQQTSGPSESLTSPQIVSIGRETWIYERPSYKSRRLGYLRLGSHVQREPQATGRESCVGGWYRIAPEGYVCNNDRTATTNARHSLASVTDVGAQRDAALPYQYSLASRGIPVFHHESGSMAPATVKSSASGTIPDWWSRARDIFGFAKLMEGSSRLGLPSSGIAWTRSFEQGVHRYALTTNLELVDMAALRPVTLSAFRGCELRDSGASHVAFVKTKQGVLYRSHSTDGAKRPVRSLTYRESFVLLDEGESGTSGDWLQTENHDFLRRDQVRLISLPRTLPGWVRPGEVWVDVSIEQQTLVAYEGNTPKYVTLVSTGVDGISDPEISKATKLGVFPIVSKHISATMDGEDEDRAYEMNEVPWVQYFSEGYALHAAYWHDAFGEPRSHGCVNLSPIDARWLFHFTNPGVPKGWHGRVVSAKTATVYVHP